MADVLNFIGAHVSALLFLAFMIIFRKPLSNLAERLIRANFSYGGATGQIEAAAPTAIGQVATTEPSITSSEKVTEPIEDKNAKELESKEAKHWFATFTETEESGDFASAEKCLEDHLTTIRDTNERHSEEAFGLFLLYKRFTNSKSLKRLESLIENSSTEQFKSSAHFLAYAYRVIKDYDKEYNFWKAALTSSKSDENVKSLAIAGQANVLSARGNPELALTLLENSLSEIKLPGNKALLFRCLWEINKKSENTAAAALAAEKVLELQAGDQTDLFDAAFIQSEADFSLLATKNYQTLIGLNPKNSSAKNNLAVAAEALKLPGIAADFYRAAAKQGETLASANLAAKYISQGLYEEAKSLLDSVRKEDNVHEKVNHELLQIEQKKAAETKAWEKILRKTAKLQTQFRIYAGKYFEANSSANFSGKWLADRGIEVQVEADGKTISAEWTEFSLGLANIAHRITINGFSKNASARVIYKKKQEPPTYTVLSGWQTTEIKCNSYLSDDGKSWILFSTEMDDDFLLTLIRAN